MDINRKNLEALEKTLQAKWTDAFNALPRNELRSIAAIYTSSSKSNFYAFLEALGGFSEWNGARQFKDIASQVAELVNKTYESSIKMPREQLLDDDTQLYMDIIPSMVRSWIKKQESLIMGVLTSNPKAFDNVELFSAAGRSYGGNTINNTTTSALTATTFEAAFVAMMSYKDHNGEPLAVRPDTLVVGPKKAKVAADIVGNKFIGDGETSASQIENFYSTLGIRLLISPYLIGDYDDYWFLTDTSSPAERGVILQIREQPSPVLSDQQEIARHGTIDYMANGRMAAGPGIPHKIYGGIVA